MTSYLTWLGPAITFVLFLGAAAIYLRGSRDKGTIATLERNNSALSERVKLLEESDVEKTARLMALEHENQRLTTMVTARDMIAQLENELHEHRTALQAKLDHIDETLVEIRHMVEADS